MNNDLIIFALGFLCCAWTIIGSAFYLWYRNFRKGFKRYEKHNDVSIKMPYFEEEDFRDFGYTKANELSDTSEG